MIVQQYGDLIIQLLISKVCTFKIYALMLVYQSVWRLELIINVSFFSIYVAEKFICIDLGFAVESVRYLHQGRCLLCGGGSATKVRPFLNLRTCIAYLTIVARSWVWRNGHLEQGARNRQCAWEACWCFKWSGRWCPMCILRDGCHLGSKSIKKEQDWIGGQGLHEPGDQIRTTFPHSIATSSDSFHSLHLMGHEILT